MVKLAPFVEVGSFVTLESAWGDDAWRWTYHGNRMTRGHRRRGHCAHDESSLDCWRGRVRVQTPRNTLNSRNRRAGNGICRRQTMLIGRSPSADSSITGPQAR